jgi:hypothetical protein
VGTKSLAGPPRSREPSSPDSRDLVAAWWQEKQYEVVDWSRCRVEAHNRSLHEGFAAVHHKTFGLLG